jgi:hypothetical protein
MRRKRPVPPSPRATDAALGDELAEPHDEDRAGSQRDDGDEQADRGRVRDDREGAAREQTVVGDRDDHGGLQHREPDRQVTGVLRELRLPGGALLVQLLEPRDHDAHELRDDAGGDVGHHPEGEHRQLEQRTPREEVDHAHEVALVAHTDALLHVVVAHARRRHECAEAEDRDQPEREEQLAPQVRSPERLKECVQHLFVS